MYANLPERGSRNCTISLVIPFATSSDEIGKFNWSMRRLMNSTSSQSTNFPAKYTSLHTSSWYSAVCS